MTDNTDFTKYYLEQLDNLKKLTKKEEHQIAKEKQKNEYQIFKLGIKYKIFRDQILELKVPLERNYKYLFRSTKRLNKLTSSPEKIKEIEKLFSCLFKSLKKFDEKKALYYIRRLKITSSTLQKILSPIFKTHNIIKELEFKVFNAYKFLEVKNEIEYEELLVRCQDANFRKSYARKLYTTEEKLIKHLSFREDLHKRYLDNNLTTEIVREYKELYKAIKDKQEEVESLKRQLIEGCMQLVVNRAKRFTNRGLPFEDLIQEGNIGLLRAVDKYEPSKNTKVSTYATWWIDLHMRRAISNLSNTIRIPIHIQELRSTLNSAFIQLSHKLGRAPTFVELSKYTKIPLKKVNMLAAAPFREVGIDEDFGNGGDQQNQTIADLLVENPKYSPFEVINTNIFKDVIGSILRKLPIKQQKVLRLRFGIGEAKSHSLQEIGDKFGISRTRIRQIEAKLLKKLKNNKFLSVD